MTALTLAAPPIVSSQWLVDNFETVTIIDTRRVEEYLDGHIPGAVSFPLGSLLIEDTSVEALQQLGHAAQQALGNRGVERDSQVVLVDDNDGSASVGVFICELAGMRSVSVVHGGVRGWLHHGGEVFNMPSSRQATVFEGEISLATVATIDDMQRASKHSSTIRLVDARSQLEHEGIVGSPCCDQRGHIPGSVHMEWTSLLSATGDLHGPTRITEEAHHVGLNEGDEIIVYCHSGQRSAICALALRAAGFTNVRNALGSWHEWSHRSLPYCPEH